MRDATKEERESVNNYIDSISKPTGMKIDFGEIPPSNLLSGRALAVYRINNIQVEIYDKQNIPNKFRRFMQKLLLGIEWETYYDE